MALSSSEHHRVTVVVPTLYRRGLPALLASISDMPELADVLCVTGHNIAAQRNAGLSMASSEFVAITDDDCVADPKWLSFGLAYMREHRLDVMGGGIRGGVETAPPHCGFMGANLWVRRKVFGKVRFDPSLRNFEDVEFIFAAQEAGLRVGHCQEAIVYHIGGLLTQERLSEDVHREAATIIAERHPDRWRHLCQWDSTQLEHRGPGPSPRFAPYAGVV